MEFHEVANLFPLMDGAEFEALKADIAANGLREPVWTWQGKIIDGRNRWRACEEVGVEPRCREWDGQGSLVRFVWSMNYPRRHLNPGQKAAAIVEFGRLADLEEQAAKRQRAAGARGNEGGRGNKKNPCANHGTRDSRADPARDVAAKEVGVSHTYISDAKKLAEKSPELFEKVRTGETTLPQAKAQMRREEKREQLEAKAAAADKARQAAPTELPWRLIHGDCVEELRRLTEKPRLIFADPPYNVGVDYGDGKAADQLPADEFCEWMKAWIRCCRNVLADDGALWVLIGDEFAAETCLLLKSYFTLQSWVKWYETFGVNCSGRFNRTSRHVFWCTVHPKAYVFHHDPVTRPSDRQTKYGDSRANPGGKLWDDVWQIPRLVDNAAERVPGFPTQLPLALVTPIVLCASDPGDLVLDPFNGSATTGMAAVTNGRRYLGIEKRREFYDLAELRLKGASP